MLRKKIFNSFTANANIAVGLKAGEKARLQKLPRFAPTSAFLWKNKVEINDAPTFLASYQEIFIDDIYKFDSNKEAPVFIDCGANIGLGTIFLKRRFIDAVIYCFEADPNLHKLLQQNVINFKFENITCYNQAVSITDGYIKFSLEGGHSGMIVDAEGENVVDVPAIRLRDFLNKFDAIEFLKIDIEGHEEKVLADIEDQLPKVEHLFIEYHSFMGKKQQLGEMLNLLTDAGFRYYIKESYNKKFPFIQKEIFLDMDFLANIFCYRN